MPNKIPKRICQRKFNHIWRFIFEELNVIGRCQFFVEMMRNLSFRPIMKILGLRMIDYSNKTNNVKKLMSTYEKVVSTLLTKDSDVTRCVLTSRIVNTPMKRS